MKKFIHQVVEVGSKWKLGAAMLTAFLLTVSVQAQNTMFYTTPKAAVYTTDTTNCKMCNSGIPTYDIASDSIFRSSKYTQVSLIAFGNNSESGSAQFFTGFTPASPTIGDVFGIPVSGAVNIIANSKQLGNIEINLGTLTDWVSDGDTLAPSIYVIAIR